MMRLASRGVPERSTAYERVALATATGLQRLARRPAPATPSPSPADISEDASSDGVQHCWPLGHHYSPVPDTRELAREPTRSRVWPAAVPETPGVDWRDDEQVRLVRELGRQPRLTFADGPTGDPTEYHTGNEFFGALDAWALQAMLRHFRPARMIEVGSGWSTLVSARVNREHLGGGMQLTAIEPYPAEFLSGGVDGLGELIPAPVQDIPVERFLELAEGDVLFIDTAHVIKTGGDVQYLYHEVLPRLRPGVVIHVHDIFLPLEYPQDWVLVGRGWNEQYLLQSFLAFNDSFEILLGVAYMWVHHPGVLGEAIPGFSRESMGGGSFWFRRRSSD
jgi:hypothetical protein